MLRDTFFLEFELQRLEDDEPAAPARRLEFSARPFEYIVGAVLLGTAALGAFAGYGYLHPPEQTPLMGIYCCLYPPYGETWNGVGTSCGLPRTDSDLVTPLRNEGDTTRLVFRAR